MKQFKAPIDTNPAWLELGNDFCEAMEEIHPKEILGEADENPFYPFDEHEFNFLCDASPAFLLSYPDCQEEVNEYRSTHTFEETIEHFHLL